MTVPEALAAALAATAEIPDADLQRRVSIAVLDLQTVWQAAKTAAGERVSQVADKINSLTLNLDENPFDTATEEIET